MSALWELMPDSSPEATTRPPVRYDAFVLALDLLFLVGAIELRDGLIVRGMP
jgi:hypothetical protein